VHILVCPGCRTRTADRLDVRTLEPASPDVLACACGLTYPVVDGVPVVTTAADIVGVVERDLAPEVAALLAAPGPDDAPYARHLEHQSIYMDAHWGDRAEPPPDGPGANGTAAVFAKLAERASQRVALAVELGCATGRGLVELARGADHVVGVDVQHASLRRARRLLAGESVAYARRVAGRNYRAAVATGLRAGNVTLVCGDALDPPLIAGMYQRVVALNLLDAVRSPRQLLAVVDGLCARGGEIVLASPYAWQSAFVDEHERIGGADPASAVRAILTSGDGLGSPYQIEDEADLPWTLRRDARSAATYCIHYVRARKH
jgi:SAM-dependent methyltransferase